MTADIACYRCMKNHVSVIGESCDRCLKKQSRRAGDCSDMSLEELVASQESGMVPGEKYREKKELPRGLIHESGRFQP